MPQECHLECLSRLIPLLFRTTLGDAELRQALDQIAAVWDAAPAALAGLRLTLADGVIAGAHFDARRIAAEVPVAVADHEFGTLALSSSAPVDAAGDENRLFLRVFAGLLAGALERRRFLCRLVQSEKLSALGELLAGIAHELNNPLTGVLGYGHLARAQPGLPQEAAAYLDKLLHEAFRCTRIVSHLLTLARQNAPVRVPLRLDEVLGATFEILAYELHTDNVAFSWRAEPGLPRIDGDRTRLQQVFINLLTNARQAMKGWAGRREVTVALGRDGAGRVCAEVTDTGPGMTADVARRAFDPFFTTKEVGQGTGLGLSLCQSIVAEHGGSIELHTASGRGAVFVCRFPRSKSERATDRYDLPGELSAAGAAAPLAGRALVVDDEPGVRDVLGAYLAALGLSVTAAAEGRQALELIARQTFDVIFCDVRMPGLDGKGFLAALGARHPELRARVAFVTGDVVRESTQHFARTHRVPVLSKPFTLKEVRALVERLLRPEREGAEREGEPPGEPAEGDRGRLGGSLALPRL